jgi:hypothetical protein
MLLVLWETLEHWNDGKIDYSEMMSRLMLSAEAKPGKRG